MLPHDLKNYLLRLVLQQRHRPCPCHFANGGHANFPLEASARAGVIFPHPSLSGTPGLAQCVRMGLEPPPHLWESWEGLSSQQGETPARRRKAGQPVPPHDFSLPLKPFTDQEEAGRGNSEKGHPPHRAWGGVWKVPREACLCLGSRSRTMVRGTVDRVAEPETQLQGEGAGMMLGSGNTCSHTTDTTRALGPLLLVVGSTAGSKLGNSDSGSGRRVGGDGERSWERLLPAPGKMGMGPTGGRRELGATLEAEAHGTSRA